MFATEGIKFIQGQRKGDEDGTMHGTQKRASHSQWSG